MVQILKKIEIQKIDCGHFKFLNKFFCNWFVRKYMGPQMFCVITCRRASIYLDVIQASSSV